MSADRSALGAAPRTQGLWQPRAGHLRPGAASSAFPVGHINIIFWWPDVRGSRFATLLSSSTPFWVHLSASSSFRKGQFNFSNGPGILAWSLLAAFSRLTAHLSSLRSLSPKLFPYLFLEAIFPASCLCLELSAPSESLTH